MIALYGHFFGSHVGSMVDHVPAMQDTPAQTWPGLANVHAPPLATTLPILQPEAPEAVEPIGTATLVNGQVFPMHSGLLVLHVPAVHVVGKQTCPGFENAQAEEVGTVPST